MTAPCVVPTCDRTDTRPYLTGDRCPDHAPHVPTPPPHGLTARSAAAPAPTPRTQPKPAESSWDTREDSTWIDRL